MAFALVRQPAFHVNFDLNHITTVVTGDLVFVLKDTYIYIHLGNINHVNNN